MMGALAVLTIISLSSATPLQLSTKSAPTASASAATSSGARAERNQLPPDAPRAPIVIPAAPRPSWSWERVPTSFHGAVKDREFTAAEVRRLARYQMTTIEKWYTPCGSAGPPHRAGEKGGGRNANYSEAHKKQAARNLARLA